MESLEVGSTLLNTILSKLSLNEANSQQEKNMTGAEPLQDYEDVFDNEDNEDGYQYETTLLTPKDKRKMPAYNAQMPRWIKTQKRQDMVKRNLSKEFDKIARKNNPKTVNIALDIQKSQRRIQDMKSNAEYHYTRYIQILRLIQGENSRLLEAKARSHPKPTVHKQPPAKKNNITPNINTGYYHPQALSKHTEIAPKRLNCRPTIWIRNIDYGEKPRYVVAPHTGLLHQVIPTKLVRDSLTTKRRAMPTRTTKEEHMKLEASQPTRTSLAAALSFMKKKNIDIQRSNSFVYNKL